MLRATTNESTIMGMTIRAGIYLRASTTGRTVENQRQELLRVAEQRGWQIAEECFVGRPALNQPDTASRETSRIAGYFGTRRPVGSGSVGAER